MSRIGFQTTDENVFAVKKISELPGIRIGGMFTHFACADTDLGTGMSAVQYARFSAVAEELALRGIRVPLPP